MLRTFAVVVVAGVMLAAPIAAQADRVVALAPLSTFGAEDKSAAIKALTQQLEQGIAGSPGTRVITTAQPATDTARTMRSVPQGIGFPLRRASQP